MKYVKKKLGCHQKKFKQKLPLSDNLGSWFSVYNLILTQLDEICKKIIGVPSKKN
jgi:hypothetical protein